MVGFPFSKILPGLSPNIMLIDEDESFSKKVVAAARRMNVSIEFRCNINEVYKNPPTEPDILILGYDLGRVNGVQLSQYLEHHARAKFVVLITNGSIEKLKIRLPECVRVVVSKDSGGEHIVGIAKLLFKTLYTT